MTSQTKNLTSKNFVETNQPNNPVLDLRTSLGITQDRMAELLGVTKNYVYLLEQNKRKPSKKLLLRMEQIQFGVPENAGHEYDKQEKVTFCHTEEGAVGILFSVLSLDEIKSLINRAILEEKWEAVILYASEILRRMK